MGKIQCRWAPSLGELESTHQEIWGTSEYTDRNAPCVFFGLYDLRDYITLWRHKGKAWVLWAGSDIRNIRSNFIFNDGKLLWLSQLMSGLGITFKNFLVKRILNKAEHWCENEAEAWQLKDIGLKVSGIAPSFLGDVKKYKVEFKPGNKVWLSANTGREIEYGWGIIANIAWALPEIEFHLFGSMWGRPSKCGHHDPGYIIGKQGLMWNDVYPNIFLHGRVTKQRMNEMVKRMQCGLRLNKHDGFSEVTAKSVLWGQYPITYLYSPHIDQFTADNHGLQWTAGNYQKLVKLLKQIPEKKTPNLKARNYYIKELNHAYPWVQKP